MGNRSLHLEVGGVLTRFAFFNPLTSQHYDAAGGGGSVNANIELVKSLRFVANTFFSAGAGRYIFGLGPDVIIRGDGSHRWYIPPPRSTASSIRRRRI